MQSRLMSYLYPVNDASIAYIKRVHYKYEYEAFEYCPTRAAKHKCHK